jgi:hypothetical protein
MKPIHLILLGGAAVAAAVVFSGGGNASLPGADDESELTGPELYRGFWILVDNDGVGNKRWTWDARTDVNGEPASTAFAEGAARSRVKAMEAAKITIDNIVNGT